MISFELSEEQQIVRSTMAEFGKTVLAPQARRLDTDSCIDDGVLAELWSTEIIQAQAEAVEEEAGSRSPVTNAIILEELGAADATLALAMASTMGFVQAIADQGSAEQRARLLGGFAGETFQAAAVAMMEPRFGFDVSRFQTKADKAGDDYIVRGVKAMVPLASRCSHFLVVAEADGAADAFIVPLDAAGVTVVEPKGALGLRALEMAEVAFDSVRVPSSMRLGEGNGADVQRIIDSARVGISSILAGLSRGVMEYVIPYTKERIVHGAPLAQKQAIAFNIADMHIDVEAMRWLNWRAAWALEARQPATRTAQLAYTYAGQQAMRIADDGLQAFGGHGFVKAHPLELWYRNARSLSVLEGAAGV
ncbi:MAG: acyl-CoA dehydrogenase domain protein [Caulobacteraceae bacterium]|nr:acyl-CoA dehydrogenase domain protein [Caulobacteraceae bacterium]